MRLRALSAAGLFRTFKDGCILRTALGATHDRMIFRTILLVLQWRTGCAKSPMRSSHIWKRGTSSLFLSGRHHRARHLSCAYRGNGAVGDRKGDVTWRARSKAARSKPAQKIWIKINGIVWYSWGDLNHRPPDPQSELVAVHGWSDRRRSP